jgi:hypothetical protein
VTTGKVRRTVTASILLAAACNVYNPSLLTGHGGTAGSGNTSATGGAGGTSGEGAAAGKAGGAGVGTGGIAGTSGRGSGGVGAAGANGGKSGATSAGSAGRENLGGEGGEAGVMGEGGTVNAGTGGGGTAGTGGAAGTAGSAGSGGSSGTGGSAGAGGSAGTAGTGGTSGSAGSGGSAGGNTASGCANLTVPLTQVSDRAHFVITLTNVQNMTTGTLSMRVYVQAGTGGLINNYVQDTGNHFLPPAARTAISSLTGTWTTLQWNVGNEATGSSGIDKTNIKRIGIEVTGMGSTAWANPTKVYVDSMSVTTGSPLSFPFDTAGTVDTNPSNGVDVGGQVLWLNSNSADTSASNVTLGWLATCP